jgi:putative FmdB family regulatory protein
MPIYEYRCLGCGGVSSFFLRSFNSPLDPSCSHCQGKDLQRRMSSFAMGKSERSVHEQFSGTGASAKDYYSDPRNIGRNVEDTFRRQGMDLPGSVRETIDAARQGSLPPGVDI